MNYIFYVINIIYNLNNIILFNFFYGYLLNDFNIRVRPRNSLDHHSKLCLQVNFSSKRHRS
jgi:hypothetical protein